MKIYTEVNYTWDDEKNELVKESEKSFNYEGELVQCISFGGYSFKPPTFKPPTIDIPTPNIADNISGILEDNSSISYGGATQPNIPTAPNINIPDASHPTSMLTAGLGKIGEGVGAIGEQFAAGGRIINRNLNELAKLGKEGMTGEGGYLSDEGPGPAAPGPTGFEAATAQRTLLTGQRRKGQGRSAHSGSGTASTV